MSFRGNEFRTDYSRVPILSAINWLLIFVIVLFCNKTALSQSWSYRGATGPNRWRFLSNIPNNQCGGRFQSPININTQCSLALPINRRQPLQFNNYNQTITSARIINNGHTVEIEHIEPEDYTISGGGLPGVYRLAQFHFHWGSYSAIGSEHAINGRKFPLELHLVHYHTNFANLSSAVGQPNGVAVIAVLFRISNVDNPLIDSLIREIPVVNNAVNNRVDINDQANVVLRNLLPRNTQLFYRYSGSLTTPPCREGVIWTVMAQTVPISESQMASFRVLRDTNGNYLSNNFRPLQPLNGRNVYSSFLVAGKHHHLFSAFKCGALPRLMFLG